MGYYNGFWCQQACKNDPLTSRPPLSGYHWDSPIGFQSSYSNGRIQNQTGLTYDASGNLIASGSTASPFDFQNTKFDSAGRKVEFLTLYTIHIDS